MMCRHVGIVEAPLLQRSTPSTVVLPEQ
ncbi:hypothetical protein E2C01_094556 [Portunus trituberculatus]|uniref:Uncharacterized protein n=1 Tax=Portunus trituberculatus TaxID=210409 RepID=A0A5B7JQR5_PORTR|nr:hypothetical protein [Portunus trituberculatus]